MDDAQNTKPLRDTVAEMFPPSEESWIDPVAFPLVAKVFAALVEDEVPPDDEWLMWGEYRPEVRAKIAAMVPVREFIRELNGLYVATGQAGPSAREDRDNVGWNVPVDETLARYPY